MATAIEIHKYRYETLVNINVYDLMIFTVAFMTVHIVFINVMK